MSSEEGIVIRIDSTAGSMAWVKTTRSSACESCSSRDSCNAEGSGKVMEVKAINAAGATVGDRVVMTIKTASLLKISFLLYIFPIVCLIAGALIGQHLALAQGYRDPSGLSILVAFAFFGGAFWAIRVKSRTMGHTNEYVPKIIKILRHRPDNSRKAGLSIATKSNDPPTG